MIKCKICLSNKPARFETADFCICQSCIKLLSLNTKTFNTVHEHVSALANKYVSGAPVKPIFDTTTDQCRKEAADILYKNEGILTYVVSSIFMSSDRKRAIDDYAYKLFSEKQSEYETKLDAYNKKYNEYVLNLDGYIQNIFTDILDGNFSRKEVDTVFRKGYRFRTMTVYKDVLTGHDKEIIKILRGYKFNLLSETKCLRYSVSKTAEEKIVIFKRDNYKCVICGSAEAQSSLPFHLHHIIALSNCGTNHHNNLATLCYKCHNKQHDFKVTKPKKRTQSRRSSPVLTSDFVAIDIETTGLKHTEHEIIEIAAVRFRNGIHTDFYSSFVKPKYRIPEHITALTGIKHSDVVDAPEVSTVLQEFKVFISNDTLVAHNATFDMKFINRYFGAIGDTISNEVHCTLKLSRITFKGLENYKLNTVAKHLDINTRQSHRAYEDALCSGYIYLNCVCKASSNKQNDSKTETQQLTKQPPPAPVVFDVLNFDEFENYISASADELYMHFMDNDDAYHVNQEEAVALCYVVPFLKYCKQNNYSSEAVKVLENKLVTIVSCFDDDIVPHIISRSKLLSDQFGKSDYGVIAVACADLVYGLSRDNYCVDKIKHFIEE